MRILTGGYFSTLQLFKVFLMARKRRLDILRHRLMPLYNFDKTEHENEWETGLLNNVDNLNYTVSVFLFNFCVVLNTFFVFQDYCTTKLTQYEE